jgi:hypothetical protein
LGNGKTLEVVVAAFSVVMSSPAVAGRHL